MQICLQRGGTLRLKGCVHLVEVVAPLPQRVEQPPLDDVHLCTAERFGGE